jgi:geranylgeranyl reductase family protein
MSPLDDVIVVGGGPAGCVAAIVLARAGLRVRLLERATFPREKLCGDTLNPGALLLLARLGLQPAEDGLPIRGMLVTGPGAVRVEGWYPAGVNGRAIRRSHLDHRLLQSAAASGVSVAERTRVEHALTDADGRVSGVAVENGHGSREIRGRLVIAADGRSSRLARALGLSRYAAAPRRWAVGGYFSNVTGISDYGEMHVRPGRYIGVAPLPDGLTNVCVVTADRFALRDPASLIATAVAAEPDLADRFTGARLETPPVCLGPLAVECPVPGMAGLLLAGDAAGFVDPMTGDGLRLAMRGAELAASVGLDALDRGGVAAAHLRLGAERRRALGRKLRFNRMLRALSGSTPAVRGAARATRLSSWPLRRVIRYVGDVAAG